MAVIEQNKWILPSVEDGSAFIVRTREAEKDLCKALDLLMHVSGSIPHVPASETKTKIEEFLGRFRKR